MNERYGEALRRFHARSDFEKGSITNPFGRDGSEGERGLARVRALLASLGNPHLALPIVHIAGSKGKGSTTAFLSTILTTAGLRTGRYVSPHLHTLRERIAIDGEPISESDFVLLFDLVLEHAVSLEAAQSELGIVTAFEISTVMAFQHVHANLCDIAVIEVGLGGTWDATNVVHPAVSVIALLDFEHTDVLGDTMREIAGNKAGIIKPGRPVVSLNQPPEGMAVIRQVSDDLRARLFVEGEDWSTTGDWRSAHFVGEGFEAGPVKLGLTGPHQLRNAGLAVQTAELLATWPDDASRYARSLTSDQRAQITRETAEAGLARTVWPARFEVIERPDAPTIIIDGAHTRASATALVDTLDEEYPNVPVEFVFGMLGAKDATGMLSQLRRRSDHITLVRPANPRAMTLDAMSDAAHLANLVSLPETSVETAINRAIERAGRHGLVVVTGSISFAAEAREALGLAKTERPLA